VNLELFVASLHAGDWKFWVDDGHICIGLPTRNVDTGLPMLLDQRIFPNPDWTSEQLAERVFVTMQFVLDHELREQFTVNNMRPYDAHRLGVTGQQHDWFIEQRGALKGY
jgi:hypothetical protein